MASAYHGGIPIYDGNKYVKHLTVLDTLKGLWVIGSRTIIPAMLVSNMVGRVSALVGLPDCGIGIQMSARFFPLSTTLRGPDQVGIRSFLSLVSWERFATSSAGSSRHRNSITATACSLGHTELHRNHWIPHRCKHAQHRWHSLELRLTQ